MKRLVALLLVLTALAGCSADWGWYVVDPTTKSGYNNLRFMLTGAYYTILLSVTAISISIVVGLLVALPGLSKKKSWRMFNRTYVELVRAVPILVLILWVYYGLPTLTGVTLSVFWAGVLALALSDSAFQAEIFRGGIQSIARGQYEAAQSISLTYRDTMRFVILPQAIRRILPALGNQLVYMHFLVNLYLLQSQLNCLVIRYVLMLTTGTSTLIVTLGYAPHMSIRYSTSPLKPLMLLQHLVV